MPNGPESQPGAEEDVVDKEEEGSEDEWEQVGPRNKTSITRQADFVRTPITDIFGGHIRYVDRLLCQWIIFSHSPLNAIMVTSQIGLPPVISSFYATSTIVLQNNSHFGLNVVRSLDSKTWGTYSQTKVLTFRWFWKLRTCAGIACLNNMVYEVLVWHSRGPY